MKKSSWSRFIKEMEVSADSMLRACNIESEERAQFLKMKSAPRMSFKPTPREQLRRLAYVCSKLTNKCRMLHEQNKWLQLAEAAYEAGTARAFALCLAISMKQASLRGTAGGIAKGRKSARFVSTANMLLDTGEVKREANIKELYHAVLLRITDSHDQVSLKTFYRLFRKEIPKAR